MIVKISMKDYQMILPNELVDIFCTIQRGTR